MTGGRREDAGPERCHRNWQSVRFPIAEAKGTVQETARSRSGGSSRFPRVGPGYLRAYDATIDRVGGDINLG
jgi:hypothetical protein